MNRATMYLKCLCYIRRYFLGCKFLLVRFFISLADFSMLCNVLPWPHLSSSSDSVFQYTVVCEVPPESASKVFKSLCAPAGQVQIGNLSFWFISMFNGWTWLMIACSDWEFYHSLLCPFLGTSGLHFLYFTARFILSNDSNTSITSWY